MDAMVYYEPDQPVLYQGRNLDPAYHRFAHRQRVELVHAYDEARVRASLGRLDGTRLHRRERLRGPGRGPRQPHRAAHVLRAGQGLRRARERVAARGRVDDVPRRRRCPARGPSSTCPTSPTRRSTRYVKKLAENVHSNPGPGRALPTFLTKAIVPEFADLIDIWCVPPQAFDVAKAAAERAKGRRVWFYNGGRPNGPTPVIDAPGHRGARRGVGGVQARRRHLLLLARRPLAAQRPEAGRAQAERLGEPDHVRQPRPAEQARGRPGLHQRRRRAALSRTRRSCTPRRTAASRGRSAPCSSRTCAGACRTTCT